MTSAPSPDLLRQQAQAAAQRGNLGEARRILEQGLAHHPSNAPLANSAGHFAMQAGDPEAAVRHFTRALELAPATLEFAVNAAIALGRLERHREALDLLIGHEGNGTGDPRYCSARANAERAVHDLGAAAQWYERCIALQPSHARALHGRARIALERCEGDAVSRFEQALAANNTDPEAWLGLAEALDAAGEQARARDLATQLVTQAPHWVAALRLLAQLRLEAVEADFAAHFAAAERMRPTDAGLARAHVAVLEGHDLFAQALEVASAAARRMPDDEGLALLEAVQAGVAGDDGLADAIFARLTLDTPERWIQEARHRLHLQQYDRAGELLDRMIAQDPDHISAWALRDCLWRLAGDPRADWLHGQKGLVQLQPLPDGAALLKEVVPVLHRLHDSAAFPLGQSLRGGTQTRGNLFDRTEPEIAHLHTALVEALENYRAALPPADPDHPLLRYRDAPWAITGSWSVRLAAGGDYHAAHLHPQGLISSASYLELPMDLGEGDAREGWIELGRPAPDLRLDLEPLYQVQPQLAHLALFPSTLYHGTRPFGAGQRMTVAIDITRAG